MPSMIRKQGLKRGKKTQQWDRVRASLKREFAEKGITYCEICGKSDYLSFAHRLKRRYITDEDELRMVALLCMDSPNGKGCHTLLEHGRSEVMFEVITEIINNR